MNTNVMEMSDKELEAAIEEKYGADWDFDELRMAESPDELIVEFMDRQFRDVKD